MSDETRQGRLELDGEVVFEKVTARIFGTDDDIPIKSWNGLVYPPSVSAEQYGILDANQDKPFTLVLEDGREGKVLISMPDPSDPMKTIKFDVTGGLH